MHHEKYVKPPKRLIIMGKCILLVRVSTDSQDLAQQTECVRNEAIKDGFSENDIITLEDMESAVKLSEFERNGLNRMKWYVEHDNIDCVYTYEPSRISRKPAVSFNIRDYLISHHVQLIILNPYMKMMNSDGTLNTEANMSFGIWAAYAENEGFFRKTRMARGREKKRKLCLYSGGNIPMGYKVIDDKFVIDEDEAKIVRRVFNEYINGKSLIVLARELLTEGVWKTKVTTDTGMKQNLLNMMTNKAYLGDSLHPAIITKQTFDAAREKAQDKRFYPKGNEDTAIFRGLMFDVNGKTMISNISQQYYFTKGTTLSFKVADTILWGIAREWYLQIYEGKRNEIINSLKEQVEIQENIIRTMNVNISSNADKIDRIEERYIEGRISKQRADELERKTFNELQGYKQTLQNAETERQRLLDLIENDKTMIAITDTLTIAEKRSIVNYIIADVVVRKLSFYVAEIVATNKITGEIRTLIVQTRRNEILEMKINAQQALPPA